MARTPGGKRGIAGNRVSGAITRPLAMREVPTAAAENVAHAHRGAHNLPCGLDADWNDCLNLNCFSETPDESYQTTGNRVGRTAESVFIAGMFWERHPEYDVERVAFIDYPNPSSPL